jgi:hypothetical protein
MAYTRASLRHDLIEINETLMGINKTRLEAEGRNGYTGLDLYDEKGACLTNITCGTPKECLAAANSHVVRALREANQK